jgi:hypothetical protein
LLHLSNWPLLPLMRHRPLQLLLRLRRPLLMLPRRQIHYLLLQLLSFLRPLLQPMHRHHGDGDVFCVSC